MSRVDDLRANVERYVARFEGELAAAESLLASDAVVYRRAIAEGATGYFLREIEGRMIVQLRAIDWASGELFGATSALRAADPSTPTDRDALCGEGLDDRHAAVRSRLSEVLALRSAGAAGSRRRHDREAAA